MGSRHNTRRLRVNLAEIEAFKINLRRIDERVTPFLEPEPSSPTPFSLPAETSQPVPVIVAVSSMSSSVSEPAKPSPMKPVTPKLKTVAPKLQPKAFAPLPLPSTSRTPYDEATLIKLRQMKDLRIYLTRIEEQRQNTLPRVPISINEVCEKIVKEKVSPVRQKPVDTKGISKFEKASYFCKICGKKYISPSGFRHHQLEHLQSPGSLDTATSKAPLQAQAEQSKPFSCPRCNEKFATKTETINHVQAHYNDIVRIKTEAASIPDRNDDDIDTFNVMPEDEPIVIKLEVDSEQDFANLNEGEDFPIPLLNSPKGKHSNRSKFHPCKYCRKVFTTSYILRSHVKTHHPGEAKVELIYACEICGLTFDTQNKLRLHARVHTGGSTHPCKYCERIFCTIYNLRHHIRKVHPEHAQTLISTCGVCGLEFSSDRDLKLHSRVHTGEKVTCCNFCTASFSDKKSFMKHVRNKHPDQSYSLGYPCQFCGKLFQNQLRLKMHTRIHSGRNMLVCKLCECAFKATSNLRAHIIKMHPEEASSYLIYSCQTCGLKFENRYKFKIHQRIHTGGKKIHPCKYCSNFFGSSFALRSHMIKIHPDEAQLSYPCEACGLEFTTEHLLRLHKRIHGGANVFPCKMCSSIFKNIYSLRSHMRATHPGEELPGIPSTCPTCGLRFPNREKLKSHQDETHPRPIQTISSRSTHSNRFTSLPSLTLPCRKCGKRFHSQLDLKIHQRVHAGKDALTCKLCPSYFKDVYLLRAHIKKCHPNQGPTYFMWPCKTCGLEFQNRFKLKLHSRMHTGDENVFPCRICALTFIGAYNLQSHMKNVHPDPMAGPSQRVHRMSTRQKFDQPSPAIDKIHSCRLCGCSFAFEMSLNQHVRAEHPEHITSCVEPEESAGNVNVKSGKEQIFIQPANKKMINKYLAMVDKFLFSELPTEIQSESNKNVRVQDSNTNTIGGADGLNLGASIAEECLAQNVDSMKSDPNMGLDLDFASSAIELCETVFLNQNECIGTDGQKVKTSVIVDLPLD